MRKENELEEENSETEKKRQQRNGTRKKSQNKEAEMNWWKKRDQAWEGDGKREGNGDKNKETVLGMGS